jgi:tetratricopeptide (TPR) repeat protein
MLLVPSGILVKNYHAHDRTGDFVPYDYAYNIMTTCDQNAILFTNGDNDTYPLWFLQGVEGVRNDIQIVNLSLIKTPWYIKQLKRLGVEFGLEYDEIDEALGGFQWEYDRGIEVAGLKLEAGDIPIAEYPTGRGRETVPALEPHTLMIWRILKHNWHNRSIYFAVTVPNINMAGLKPYLSMEGMAYKLVKTRGYEQFDEEKIRHNLLEVYRYTGVADSTVHKDPVARRLLSNYLILFDGLIRAYIQLGMHKEAYDVLAELEERVPPYALDSPETYLILFDGLIRAYIQLGMHKEAYDILAEFEKRVLPYALNTPGTRRFVGEHYRALAVYFYESGDMSRAVSSLENLLRLGPPLENSEDIHALIDKWKSGTTPKEVDSVGSIMR